MIDFLVFHVVGSVVFLGCFLVYCLWMRDHLNRNDREIVIIVSLLCLFCWEYVMSAGCFRFTKDSLLAAKKVRDKKCNPICCVDCKHFRRPNNCPEKEIKVQPFFLDECNLAERKNDERIAESEEKR